MTAEVNRAVADALKRHGHFLRGGTEDGGFHIRVWLDPRDGDTEVVLRNEDAFDAMQMVAMDYKHEIDRLHRPQPLELTCSRAGCFANLIIPPQYDEADGRWVYPLEPMTGWQLAPAHCCPDHAA